MNKPDLALNNLQWLICHKTNPNNYGHTGHFYNGNNKVCYLIPQGNLECAA